MSNPTHCDRVSVKNGKTKAGTQRYKCKICGKTFSADADIKPSNKPKILDRPMTARERKRRSRGKKDWKDLE